MPPVALHFALIYALLPFLASAAGITSAVCDVAALRFSFNKEGVSPCQVAADLGAVCSNTGDFTIEPLASPTNDNFYPGPSSLATPCQCSGVYYNLISACGLCQGGATATWNYFVRSCASISPRSFPFNIPLGTFVPHWAYLDPTQAGQFNAAAAQAAGDDPESTFTPSPTGKSTNNSNKSSTNVGAIAGGVAGGVVAIAVAGGLVFLFLRKKANSLKESANNVGGVSSMHQTLRDSGQPYSMPTLPSPDASSQNAPPLSTSQQQSYSTYNPSISPSSPNTFGETSMLHSISDDRHSTRTPPQMYHPGYGSEQSQHGSIMTSLVGKADGYHGVAEI